MPTVRFPTAKSFWLPTFGSALVTLAGCSSAPIVYKDRLIEVPVPVREQLDARLTQDCAPSYKPPRTGTLPVSAALDRLAAVEEALAKCRAQLQEIRTIK